MQAIGEQRAELRNWTSLKNLSWTYGGRDKWESKNKMNDRPSLEDELPIGRRF